MGWSLHAPICGHPSVSFKDSTNSNEACPEHRNDSTKSVECSQATMWELFFVKCFICFRTLRLGGDLWVCLRRGPLFGRFRKGGNQKEHQSFCPNACTKAQSCSILHPFVRPFQPNSRHLRHCLPKNLGAFLRSKPSSGDPWPLQQRVQ